MSSSEDPLNEALNDDRAVTIETVRLVLTLPPPEAAAGVVQYYVDNIEHFAPWDPPRPSGFYTVEFWRDRLAKNRRELARDQSLRLFLYARDAQDAPPIGSVNFTGFIRGPFQACLLGYGLAKKAEGKGLMLEALRAALPVVFEGMGFHRVMANYVPTNARSGRLLEKLGFEKEGYAKNYLFIDGEWRDHVLTALTNPDPRPPRI